MLSQMNEDYLKFLETADFVEEENEENGKIYKCLANGNVFESDRQRYLLIGRHLFQLRGFAGALLFNLWESRCRKCGALYRTFSLGNRKVMHHIGRNCKIHSGHVFVGDEPRAFWPDPPHWVFSDLI